MARLARIVVPGLAHHVTQRGNRREPIFFESGDQDVYRDLLAEQARKARLSVWAYCLMPNHVHLVVVPEDSESIGRAIGEAHRRYKSDETSEDRINRLHPPRNLTPSDEVSNRSISTRRVQHSAGNNSAPPRPTRKEVQPRLILEEEHAQFGLRGMVDREVLNRGKSNLTGGHCAHSVIYRSSRT